MTQRVPSFLGVDACAARGNVPPAAGGRSLSSNQDGAIMVIGVFMAIVLVGFLFYVAGVGQAVFRRERMQDAADAVALASAIGHARGMNLIVFINLVMAALVAIVLALKVIELLLTVLTLVLAAISWFVPPAAAAIPVVNNFRSIMHDVHDTARDIVDNVLLGLNLAEQAIRVITPAQSVLTSMLTVGDKYSSVAEHTVAVPPRFTLPVENDKYNTLCDKAQIILSDLIKGATSGVPFVSKVIGLITDVITGVAKAFCYRDGTPPPSTTTKFTRILPTSQTGADCETDKTNLVVPSENCQKWEEEVRLRHPEQDGNCPGQEDERRQQLCDSAVSLARVKCDPRAKPSAFDYSWSEQTAEEHVVFDVKKWVWRTDSFRYLDTPKPELKNTSSFAEAQQSFLDAENEAAKVDPEHPEQSAAYFNQVEADQNQKPPFTGKPCDNRGLQYNEYVRPEELWSEWNVQVYWEEFPGEVRPLCDRRLAAVKTTLPNAGEVPENIYGGVLPPGFNAAGYTLRYPTVKHVYGCAEKADLELKFPEDWTSAQAAQSGDDKAPQKMEEGVELGKGDFQIRGLAINFGDRRPANIQQGLENGAFERRMEPESWVGAALGLGKVAVAQAEYYFNHDGVNHAKREDWMWTMDWKARLVRFRLPSDDQNQQQQQYGQGDMSLASLSSVGGDKLNVDLSSVDLPGEAANLDIIEQLTVH